MAASMSNTTLRRTLSQPKPLVPCKVKAGKNTRGRWPKFESGNITVWDDFNLDNLNESYGHILDRDVPAQALAVPQPGRVLASTTEIACGNDINHLIMWSDEVIGPALDFSRELLNLHSGVFLRRRISTPDKSAIAWIRYGRQIAKVDHCIELDEYPVSNLVIGLGRPSSRFPGRKLADYPEHALREGLWPLRQLANACIMAKTRYGYILTDEDLVACCFSRNGANKWKVALMPIPWSRHGENQLTTDLALWWLSMLAMSAPYHRAIVEEEEIVRINEWEVRYLDEERGWVRRHKYSNFEEPVDPPSPPVYRSPSPGNAAANAAAFAAQVGINADPLFDFDAMADADLGDFDLDAIIFNP
ncbi:hypothetical protein F5Y10DRAFT_273789 [Nemania abortiva]|nr:hypothetical protein F5Y10DRAFT_273789 [Nemania abortiva]